MGRIQPTSLAQSRVVFSRQFNRLSRTMTICHSINDRSVPVVREPDSPELPPAPEALAGAETSAEISE